MFRGVPTQKGVRRLKCKNCGHINVFDPATLMGPPAHVRFEQTMTCSKTQRQFLAVWSGPKTAEKLPFLKAVPLDDKPSTTTCSVSQGKRVGHDKLDWSEFKCPICHHQGDGDTGHFLIQCNDCDGLFCAGAVYKSFFGLYARTMCGKTACNDKPLNTVPNIAMSGAASRQAAAAAVNSLRAKPRALRLSDGRTRK